LARGNSAALQLPAGMRPLRGGSPRPHLLLT
jgi:hypothetical protein